MLHRKRGRDPLHTGGAADNAYLDGWDCLDRLDYLDYLDYLGSASSVSCFSKRLKIRCV